VPLLPIGDITQSLAFLIFAYFTGSMLQALGEKYQEHFLKKRWGGLPSERFLREDDERYSKEYKNKIREAIKDYFDITIDEINIKQSDKKCQELFYKCYSLISSKKDFCGKVEAFSSAYGFFRGLIVTSILSSVAFLISTILLLLRLKETGYSSDIIISILFFILFSICVFISGMRTKKRGEDFAGAVYQGFYVYYCDIKQSKK